MVEPEAAFFELTDNMDLAERFLKRIFRDVLARCPEDMEFIRERIDKIVEFSELGDHINAPTRTFSSGMVARLGFSIAVHVDADILLVDEVLAVGDFEFEKKCIAKIDEFRASGGTILVVSHNTYAVRRIADRCVWLHKGHVKMIGTPDEVLPVYESTSMDSDTPI